MAKGIREHLLEQAIKFHQWQKATYPGKTAEAVSYTHLDVYKRQGAGSSRSDQSLYRGRI